MSSNFMPSKQLMQIYLLASTMMLPFGIHDVLNKSENETKILNEYNNCAMAVKENKCTIEKRDELHNNLQRSEELEMTTLGISGSLIILSSAGLYSGRREKNLKAKQKSDLEKIKENNRIAAEKTAHKRKQLAKNGLST